MQEWEYILNKPIISGAVISPARCFRKDKVEKTANKPVFSKKSKGLISSSTEKSRIAGVGEVMVWLSAINHLEIMKNY